MKNIKKGAFLFICLNMLAVSQALGGEMRFHALLSGSELKQNFNQATGIFFDYTKKKLYVADTGNNRLVSFDSKLKYLAQFNADGELKNPISLVRTKDGNFYFIDGKKKELYVVDIPRKIFKPVKIIDAPERSNPVLLGRLAIDNNDNLYMTDIGNGRILKLDSKGRYLKEIAVENRHIDFNELCVDRGGNIYTISTIDGKVYVFNKEGENILSFGKRGNGAKEFSFPVSIAVDGKGYIYVLDKHKGKVHVFSNDGVYQYGFSRKGNMPGELHGPSHIFVDGDRKIYIMDSGNDRIQVFLSES